MENEQKQTTPVEKPTLSQLWQDIKKNRKLYYKVLPISFVFSAIIMLSIPNYYRCTVKLAPELSNMGVKSGGALSSIASSFGINLGGASAGADALLPTLYPDLMNSVNFRASLFPIKVQREDEETTITYYDYLKDGQKSPWWTAGIKAIFSIFEEKEPSDNQVNTFKLTKEQTKIAKTIEKKVVCDVDIKTMVITIDVEDQDPLICATIADSVQQHLQEFITQYRTKKARLDLTYNQKLYAEAKERYEKARNKYASFTDANQKVFLESVLSKQSELQTELQIYQNAYTQMATQLQLSEAKVQQETPAFTELQPATVPVNKSGPNRKMIVLGFMFMAALGVTIYIICHEGHVKLILTALRQDFHQEVFDEDELLFLSRLFSKQTSNK